jgi:heme exporter protein B
MSYQGFTIAKNDIVTEFKTMRMLLTMLIFGIMVLLSFKFAFTYYATDFVPLVAPILWITFVFAGMFRLVSSFAKEKDTGCLEGLMLAPSGRWSIYVGKLLSNLALLLIIDFVALLFFGVFFAYDYGGNILGVAIVIILGTVAFAVAGTLVSGIAVNAKGREIVFPILLIPMIVLTVLMPSINATSMALDGGILDAIPEIRIIAMFSVIYIALSYVLFEFVMED